MTDTYEIEVQYTNTFGGEPNYCWLKRATIEIPNGLSKRGIMRRMKAAVGLSGVRGRSYSYGDSWEFRPYRLCTILMGDVLY